MSSINTPILDATADESGFLPYQVQVLAYFPVSHWHGVAQGSTVSYLLEAAREAFDAGASFVSFRSPFGELERVGNPDSARDNVGPVLRRFVSNDALSNGDAYYYEYQGWVCRDARTGEIVGDTIDPAYIREDVNTPNLVLDNPLEP